MNRVQLPPEIADAVGFRWQGGAHGLLLAVRLPDDFGEADETVRAVLPGFLSIGSFGEITGLTSALLIHRSYGTDARGVIFHNPPDARDPRQVGFSIEDGTDNELLLGEEAFMALMARWLGALRDGALDSDDPATRADWWPQWAANVAELERSATAPA